MKNSESLVVIVCCALASACGSSTEPGQPGYAGQWSGTTTQGRPITFTISADEMVTAISVGHEFNGCAGSETFSNLSIPIAPNVQCIPGPCPAPVTAYRAFAYSAGDARSGPATSLNALFLGPGRAEGRVNFIEFPGCGSSLGVSWAATKR
jgi:hypothetical protein